MQRKPKLALYKFTSCSGCQQALLNAEAALVDIFTKADVVHFVEIKRENIGGPYDLVLVEGSASTPEEIEVLKNLREEAQILVAIGACAVYGGPQALRNWLDLNKLKEASYPHSEWIDGMEWTGGIDTYVPVDYKVYGCGPNPDQLVEVITSYLTGRQPSLPQYSVCVDCKLKGNVCLLVTGYNCMGPITATGCGAACPSRRRGCYGCFGPMSAPNIRALSRVLEMLGNSAEDIVRIFRNQNSNAAPFREGAREYARKRRIAA